MKHTIRSIASLLFLMFLPVLGSAQEPTSTAFSDEFIPRELVAGLLNISDESESALLVGQIPEEARAEVPLPEGARLLGSLAGPDSSAIVTVVRGTPSHVRAAYTDLLKASGWNEPQSAVQRGGFHLPLAQQLTGYCNAKDSFLTVTVSGRDDHTSRVVVRLQRAHSNVYGPCRGPGQADSGRPEESPMPTLVVPTGVQHVGMGGCSSGMGERGDTMRLMTNLSVKELLVHFAEQLPAQGWVLKEEATSTGIAVQTWSLEDDKGQRWQGVLSVIARGADSSARDVSFQLLKNS